MSFKPDAKWLDFVWISKKIGAVDVPGRKLLVPYEPKEQRIGTCILDGAVDMTGSSENPMSDSSASEKRSTTRTLKQRLSKLMHDVNHEGILDRLLETCRKVNQEDTCLLYTSDAADE